MLRFCDSCDHYATADRGLKYTNPGGSWIISSGGRFGTNRLQFLGGSTDPLLLTLDSQQEWIFGWAFLPTTIYNGNSFFRLRDGGTTHIDVGTSGFKLSVRRNGTQIGLGTTDLVPSAYYFFEMRVFIHDTLGEVELRLNNIPEITLTNQDTRNGANASADNFWWGAELDQAWSMDDIYICDAVDSGVVGAPNDSFLGDVRVEARFPNGNGDSSQWLGSDGNNTDNYLLVDESTPNGDTDYVEEATVTEKDLYDYQSVSPTAGTIYGIQPMPYARKTDTGAKEFAVVAKLDGGTEEDGDSHALSTSYLYYRTIREADPDGDVWSITNFNDAQFGPKVTA